MEDANKITPSQYFDYLKNAKNQITTEALKNSYGSFLSLAEKYHKLGQKESLKKLSFLLDTLIKEEKLITLGITTYIYRDVVEDYITNVCDKSVKIVELSRYMREIPDELVDTVTGTKDIFDEFYVVFTDYTGREERKIDKERRDKDPILFGVFRNGTNVADRFYFLGDWVDEYCDLTLDKMVSEYAEKKSKDILLETKIPDSAEELVEILKVYKADLNAIKNNNEYVVSAMEGETLSVGHFVNATHAAIEADKRKGFFDKIRSAFNKKKGDR